MPGSEPDVLPTTPSPSVDVVAGRPGFEPEASVLETEMLPITPPPHRVPDEVRTRVLPGHNRMLHQLSYRHHVGSVERLPRYGAGCRVRTGDVTLEGSCVSSYTNPACSGQRSVLALPIANAKGRNPPPASCVVCQSQLAISIKLASTGHGKQTMLALLLCDPQRVMTPVGHLSYLRIGAESWT